MFPRQRLATRAIVEEIPIDLQLFMWLCIDSLRVERDYLQVFELSSKDGNQRILHKQEVPPYAKDYLFESDAPISAKIFVINDGAYATMLFAEEY